MRHHALLNANMRHEMKVRRKETFHFEAVGRARTSSWHAEVSCEPCFLFAWKETIIGMLYVQNTKEKLSSQHFHCLWEL